MSKIKQPIQDNRPALSVSNKAFIDADALVAKLTQLGTGRQDLSLDKEIKTTYKNLSDTLQNTGDYKGVGYFTLPFYQDLRKDLSKVGKDIKKQVQNNKNLSGSEKVELATFIDSSIIKLKLFIDCIIDKPSSKEIHKKIEELQKIEELTTNQPYDLTVLKVLDGISKSDVFVRSIYFNRSTYDKINEIRNDLLTQKPAAIKTLSASTNAQDTVKAYELIQELYQIEPTRDIAQSVVTTGMRAVNALSTTPKGQNYAQNIDVAYKIAKELYEIEPTRDIAQSVVNTGVMAAIQLKLTPAAYEILKDILKLQNKLYETDKEAKDLGEDFDAYDNLTTLFAKFYDLDRMYPEVDDKFPEAGTKAKICFNFEKEIALKHPELKAIQDGLSKMVDTEKKHRKLLTDSQELQSKNPESNHVSNEKGANLKTSFSSAPLDDKNSATPQDAISPPPGYMRVYPESPAASEQNITLAKMDAIAAQVEARARAKVEARAKVKETAEVKDTAVAKDMLEFQGTMLAAAGLGSISSAYNPIVERLVEKKIMVPVWGQKPSGDRPIVPVRSSKNDPSKDSSSPAPSTSPKHSATTKVENSKEQDLFENALAVLEISKGSTFKCSTNQIGVDEYLRLSCGGQNKEKEHFTKLVTHFRKNHPELNPTKDSKFDHLILDTSFQQSEELKDYARDFIIAHRETGGKPEEDYLMYLESFTNHDLLRSLLEDSDVQNMGEGADTFTND